LSTADFLKQAAGSKVARVPGTAIYMSRTPDRTPPALLRNLKYNGVLHECIVFLTVLIEDQPRVTETRRVEVGSPGNGIYGVVARYGFLEDANIPKLLAGIDVPGLDFAGETTSFFLGKETIFATTRPGMAMWRERLFAFLSRNARSATHFFCLPPDRVVELGAQIEI
ncbi:MAG: KUP/HAK/KT family potassium transporter, partial [Acidobacteriota bacterium]|nr:KUP/HAK/KT family potassium transporter [Acidobacteriota bacterium]